MDDNKDIPQVPTDERKCRFCQKEIIESRRWRFCSRRCQRAFVKKQYRDMNPLRSVLLASNVKGAISELKVCANLLEMGCEVFRSVAMTCSCDLVVLSNMKLYRIEVTTGGSTMDGSVTRVAKDSDKYDILAIVHRNKEQILYLDKDDQPFDVKSLHDKSIQARPRGDKNHRTNLRKSLNKIRNEIHHESMGKYGLKQKPVESYRMRTPFVAPAIESSQN